MNVEALPALGAHDEVAPLRPPGALQPADAAAPSFADRIGSGLEQLNTQLLGSQRDLQTLAVGEAENLHDIMIRLEESRMALQLMLQVRNRVLEAYQDVMRMQV
ncbi:MAG TPA: flagellar hook-basal body complex protein FliE [Ramlibacter sp.]|uniref:flagellar hook-basal body complex protein FliE n=1 Tax=Ramlibacter sp. TaxID=1917967 RepID=UPI002ED0AD90